MKTNSEEQILASELLPNGDGISTSIHLNDDETECYLTMSTETTVTLSADKLLEALKHHEITIGLDIEAIKICCMALSTGKSVENILIAKGREPEHGRAAFIDFKIKPGTDTPEYEENEAGAIDYHSAHLFENVHKGQTIATLQTAIPGTAGVTVHDKAIPVKDQSKIITMKAGDGVALRNNDQECVALIDGRVVLHNENISVTDKLVIDGDVDYETGDIDFIGFVHIKGDVHDDYSIKAVKGINIDKNTGHCNIESDGDINIGGMTGVEGKGYIKCGGNLNARYLHDVTVECQGDIFIKTEAMNCMIKAFGSVTILGLIAGGECTTGAGLEAGRIGTDGDVTTHIQAGINYQSEENIDALHIELHEVRANVNAKIEETGVYAKRDPSSLSNEEKEAMTVLFFDLDDLNERRREIEKNIISIRDKTRDKDNAKINIGKEIHRGTIIHLGHTTHNVEDMLKGQFSAIEHLGTEIRFVKMTPLSKMAKEIEAELIAEEQKEAKENDNNFKICM